ncbi:hypothetical protein HK105_202201 [Polyrhizophydium stewartii]|uniref:Ankyrin repeat protein n=1 Tax=Polyrhizophydium stewartii TaxID=2732419 RepID=A0ABR4NFP0_9FUNG
MNGTGTARTQPPSPASTPPPELPAPAAVVSILKSEAPLRASHSPNDDHETAPRPPRAPSPAVALPPTPASPTAAAEPASPNVDVADGFQGLLAMLLTGVIQPPVLPDTVSLVWAECLAADNVQLVPVVAARLAALGALAPLSWELLLVHSPDMLSAVGQHGLVCADTPSARIGPQPAAPAAQACATPCGDADDIAETARKAATAATAVASSPTTPPSTPTFGAAAAAAAAAAGPACQPPLSGLTVTDLPEAHLHLLLPMIAAATAPTFRWATMVHLLQRFPFWIDRPATRRLVFVAAAGSGHNELVAAALQLRPITQHTLACALDVAAANGHAATVRLLHPRLTEPAASVRGAVLGGHLDIVEFLCTAAANAFKSCPARDAVRARRLRELVWLLENTAMATHPLGRDVLDEAARAGWGELLAHSAAKRVTRGIRLAMLCELAAHGRADTLDLVLRCGTPAEWTPAVLDAAARLGRAQVAALLIDRRPAPLSPRALDIAIQHGHPRVVSQLVAAGARLPRTVHSVKRAAAAGHFDTVRLCVELMRGDKYCWRSVASVAHGAGHSEITRLITRQNTEQPRRLGTLRGC